VFTYLAVGVIVGQSSSLTPDYSKAKIAAQKVFTFIDSIPSIDNQSDEGLRPVSAMLVTILTFNEGDWCYHIDDTKPCAT
jgi:hypothetical protein